MRQEHLKSYLEIAEAKNPGISNSIRNTVSCVVGDHLDSYAGTGSLTGLLVGEVQSGKTSQMFGLIAAAADTPYSLFVLLTSDNTKLQEQTLIRAMSSLETFNVCGEADELRFKSLARRLPTLIVLKKNASVLRRWLGILSNSEYARERPLFILDDEGDAASLNTMVNADEISAINNTLNSIRSVGTGDVYIQVTATPQSLFLQANISEFRPSFVYYFPPGPGYLGGDFFFSVPTSFAIKTTKEGELQDIIENRTIPEGVEYALYSFLISSAHQLLTLRNPNFVSNFLIHPSSRIDAHQVFADVLNAYMLEHMSAGTSDRFKSNLNRAWHDMKTTKPDLIDLDDIQRYYSEGHLPSIIVLNSRSDSGSDYSKGMNIIVGGNTLGRGVTFENLNTVYYCRNARVPQADTFWQHSRIFGYDRDSHLCRIYIPPSLLKIFTELNAAHKMLVRQVLRNDLNNIELLYPPHLRPTRRNVVDRSELELVVGGMNYFPISPNLDNCDILDGKLSSYGSSGKVRVSLEDIKDLLEICRIYDIDDWSATAYINCIDALIASKKATEGWLIVRRGRNIQQGTGSLLSPDDRSLGATSKDLPVLTLYRLNGLEQQGWAGSPLWVPNIKLPDNLNFYKMDDAVVDIHDESPMPVAQVNS